MIGRLSCLLWLRTQSLKDADGELRQMVSVYQHA
jgi:hypothetical protein